MAVKIKFDMEHNAEQPNLILAARNGQLIGVLPVNGLKVKDCMTSYAAMNFTVYKDECNDGIWAEIKDFKLVWAKDWNRLFEIQVQVNDGDSPNKTITCMSLGEAELSQIKIYGFEVNTEDDISRDDYEPTVFYDPQNVSASLLDKVLKDAPNYQIAHVDDSIAPIQRTFSFDDKDIYSAFLEIEKELNCLIKIECKLNAEHQIIREVSVYDLESYCLDCKTRGDFVDQCSKCKGLNIKPGYGKDTSIFISSENLADEIVLKTNVDSVKNYFRLVAGDDLMTATIANNSPSGAAYIWHMSDEMKADMSAELSAKLDEYERDYAFYRDQYVVDLSSYQDSARIISEYNALIAKYHTEFPSGKEVSSKITGYSGLIGLYYDTVDFYLLLTNKMMPAVEINKTTALLEIEKLVALNNIPVAVQNIDTCSVQTATGAVLSIAKVIADSSRYKITAVDETYSAGVWSGKFNVVSYADENDAATSNLVVVDITGDYERFIKQKLDIALNKSKDENTDAVELFNKSEAEFANELKKYSVSYLSSILDNCQSCVDILIEQRASDPSSPIYSSIYLKYYGRISVIQSELNLRKSEAAVVAGELDASGHVVKYGLQNLLSSEKSKINNTLNFHNYLGDTLWSELSSFRRDDIYRNDNYISDGLSNSELLNRASEFVNAANKEIYKSASLQHSISATLSNLLAMKEFEPIVDKFEVGNWIRVRIDGVVYKLRLLEYEIDFDNLSNLNIVFSDVTKTFDPALDIENVLNQASSVSSSFSYVAHQAEQGEKGNSMLSGWVKNGLSLTQMKIVDNPDNQNVVLDSHGLLCREYIPELEEYDDKQLKVINRGLYLTDDNWLTSRAGIGNFTFYNPMTKRVEESYGVIADTLVGSYVLSENVGIYNEDNSITLDKDGITVTADNTVPGMNKMTFTVQRKDLDKDGSEKISKLLSLDENGNLCLDGTFTINSNGKTQDFNGYIESVKNDIKGHVTTWFYPHDPTLENEPYISWTNEEKDLYVDNLFYNTKSGKLYRWSGTSWDKLEDVDIKKALDDATSAQTTANNKRRTFLSTPVPPYDPGDMWFDGDGNIEVCIIAKSAGQEYSELDWSKRDSYLDRSDAQEISRNETSKKLLEYDAIMSGKIGALEDRENILEDQINAKYNSAVNYSQTILNDYKADVGQYLRYDENGLTLGASSSDFKTVIDNLGLYFKQGDTIVSYVNNKQLHIPNAVIESTLILGKFFFSPRDDGGVSLVWQE